MFGLSLPAVATFVMSLITKGIDFVSMLVKGKQDDKLRQAGQNDQKLADIQVSTQEQAKINATPYPTGGADLDDSLQPGSKDQF